jgi:hypothetical protein
MIRPLAVQVLAQKPMAHLHFLYIQEIQNVI